MFIELLENGEKLSLKETAKLLGCTQHNVQRLIQSKKLLAIKTSPKKFFVRRADIDAYLIEMNRDMPIPVPPTPIEIVRQNRAAAIKAGREAIARHLVNRNKSKKKGTKS